MKHYLWLFLLPCLLLPVSPIANSAPFNKPFSLSVQNDSIQNVLSVFARQMGYVARFDKGIEGQLSGSFRQIPGDDFIKTVEQAYGIKYYRKDRNIHFYPVSDLGVQVARYPYIDNLKMRELIRNNSLVSPDLPLVFDQRSGMVTISGPSLYRMAIMAYFANLEAAEKSIRVMEVFPLKYAWAGDVQIANINNNASIPGIASVLQSMTGSTAAGAQGFANNSPVRGMTPMLPAGMTMPMTAEVPTTAGGLGQDINMQAPIIVADPRQNAVIITDYAYKMPIYKSIIDKLDVAPELVQIEVSIVDVDVNQQMNFGVDWAFARESGGSTSGNLSSSNSPALDAGMNLTAIYTKGVSTFMATAKALENKGDSKILGRPSLLTMNNIQATLESTNTFYVRTVGQDVAELFDVTYGTVLQVTPSIVDNKGRRQIRLQIHVKDGSENSQATGADDIPVVKQTSINTQGVVQEGQSLLIGGYYYMEKSSHKSGVPLLMDLPAVGSLFSTNKDTSRTMQRLILITPKIVDLGDMAGAEGQQLINSLVPSA